MNERRKPAADGGAEPARKSLFARLAALTRATLASLLLRAVLSARPVRATLALQDGGIDPPEGEPTWHRGAHHRQDDADRAPGDRPISEDEESLSPRLGSYFIGLGLAVLLTAASFVVARYGLVWKPGVPILLVVLAIAQMGVHLVFFLHITTGPDNTNNVMALAFGTLIVILLIGGSLWIMANLDHNMMPMDEIMKRQR